MILIMQLFLGGLMIVGSVLFHAVMMDKLIRAAAPLEDFMRRHGGVLWQALTVSAVVGVIFCLHVIIMWAWAGLYMARSCAPLAGFADALYFSTVSYSTLGYGDLVLGPSCRMLGAIEAANGFLLFGWSVAFIYELVSRLYRREAGKL